MAIATSLWFDPKLEATVRTSWAEMARRGICTLLHDGPYRPHVTLGVWEPAELKSFTRELKATLGATPALEIVFGAVGGFTGARGVVYLQPGITHELLGVRERIHTLAARLEARPASWYPQGPWFPHCTVATELDRDAFMRASHLLQSLELPLSGHAVAVGVIDTPAEVELERIPLDRR